MSVVKTTSGKCKRCYTCVRNCPVKAISVEAGMAKVLDDLCVSCGTCVRVCTQKAKLVDNDIEPVQKALSEGQPLSALVAPSFPASFHNTHAKQVVAGLKRLGFSKVIEVAFGAELVGREAQRLMNSPLSNRPIISSACPVVVSLVEMHFPELIPHLAPIVSPLLALGRYLRATETAPMKLVFIGPCIAKKQEIRDPNLSGLIDFALTFHEVKLLLSEKGIKCHEIPGLPMDPPYPGQGRIFPLMGGLLRTGGIGTDILDSRIAIIEGYPETLEFLSTFKRSPSRLEFVDLLFCRGCIDGVEIDSPLSHTEKQRKILELVAESRHLNPSSLPEIELKRNFEDRKKRLAEPTEAQVTAILKEFGKEKPEDELNCGACGYISCREKAKAVFHGFAEPEMCLPQIIKQLEDGYTMLRQSHDQLKKAQDELVHSEKLASLGQLSAGVAHELNNPLGGILLFSNLLLEKLQKEPADEVPEELQVIVKEAARCRNIVRGLLDFARQSKLQRTSVDISALASEILGIVMRSSGPEIRKQETYDPLFPPTLVDPVQFRQALTNIIQNAMEAMPKGGTCSVSTRFIPDIHEGEVVISDTGTGIPEDVVPKLFTPFFTTKGIGKGTGLGLAISYGIIKMHRGTISVKTRPGEGTSFIIRFPVEEAASAAHGSE